MKWKDFILKNVGKSGMVVYTYSLSIEDAETGELPQFKATVNYTGSTRSAGATKWNIV